MRVVNEAWVLPNPPSWHGKLATVVKKAVTGLERVFVSRKQEPVWVSWDD